MILRQKLLFFITWLGISILGIILIFSLIQLVFYLAQNPLAGVLILSIFPFFYATYNITKYFFKKDIPY